MGVTELEAIVAILSSMGDVTIRGLMWFFGYGLIKEIMFTVLMVFLIIVAYKVITKVIEAASGSALKGLRDQMSIGTVGDVGRQEIQQMTSWVAEATNIKDRAKDYRERLKVANENHEIIQKDFETMAHACEVYRMTIAELKEQLVSPETPKEEPNVQQVGTCIDESERPSIGR
jgi:hypothetical protein